MWWSEEGRKSSQNVSDLLTRCQYVLMRKLTRLLHRSKQPHDSHLVCMHVCVACEPDLSLSPPSTSSRREAATGYNVQIVRKTHETVFEWLA